MQLLGQYSGCPSSTQPVAPGAALLVVVRQKADASVVSSARPATTKQTAMRRSGRMGHSPCGGDRSFGGFDRSAIELGDGGERRDAAAIEKVTEVRTLRQAPGIEEELPLRARRDGGDAFGRRAQEEHPLGSRGENRFAFHDLTDRSHDAAARL